MMNYSWLGEGRKVQLIPKPGWHLGLGCVVLDRDLFANCQMSCLQRCSVCHCERVLRDKESFFPGACYCLDKKIIGIYVGASGS